ncbi:hypothetical protein J437_LFUL008279 [Ladona fulva]|uniref:Uncharacterized protein n=1 Tax=Ladona fulva TaxID=123851 RepID=A0A8K0KA01_LADFU|nr:hypothetical protein J437_LFUL008279 [Ladona fulva]
MELGQVDCPDKECDAEDGMTSWYNSLFDLAAVTAEVELSSLHGVNIWSEISVHKRVMATTGVSKCTLKRISKEGKDICDGLSQSFTSLRKSKLQKCSKSTVDDFDVQVIRRTINEFHLEEKKHPTL